MASNAACQANRSLWNGPESLEEFAWREDGHGRRESEQMPIAGDEHLGTRRSEQVDKVLSIRVWASMLRFGDTETYDPLTGA
ncbi:MAG TPA: hypothetical protein VG815_09980 [Chloroflexota bacterium]|jgi:hypothetical protein|nr:hypothetical protein [Chloroflexota bacterium]